MDDKQKNNDVNKEKNEKQNINKNVENKNENKQNNNIKIEKQNDPNKKDNTAENKNEDKQKNDKTEKNVKNNEPKKMKKKSSKKSLIVIIVIIVAFILIDVILAVKTISGNKNKPQENAINEVQNVIEKTNKNKIDTVEKISYTDFSMNNYNFKINSKYKIDIQNDILTIQKDNERAIVTINAGTMEQIQNNLDLLTVPIESQGATIIKKPELQNINGKDVYVLEYSIDEKNYIVAYTNLDEENIIDMIAESTSSIDLLVELSNNYTKI